MTRKKAVILLATVLPALAALSLAAFFFFKGGGAGTSSQDAGTATIIEVEVITSGESIEISGNIEPADSVDLAFPMAGYIEAILVREGDSVKKGEVVAILEDSQQRYNLAEVEISIDSALVSGTQRNLNLLKLKKEMMVSALEDTRLVTSITGLVTLVDGKKGDWVTAQQAGSAKDIVVRVIDRSSMIATVEVDELDAPLLKTGQDVVFQFDAYPELEVRGKITSIPLEARETSQGIAVLDTVVTINDPPEEILPYFTFAGEILLGDETEVLLLPSEAIVTRGDRNLVLKVVTTSEAEESRSSQQFPGTGSEGNGGNRPAGTGADAPDRTGRAPFSLVLPDGLAVIPVPVTIEASGAGKVRIVSGLAPGDRVALPASGDNTGETVGSSAGDTRESANVMELLGMPSRRSGGGGPPPAGPGQG